MLKSFISKSPSVSSNEYQSLAKSLAAIGSLQTLRLAPVPGSNSSFITATLSASSNCDNDSHPNSLKQAPNPSIVWPVTE